MQIDKYILETLNKEQNKGFKAMLGLQMVNAGQSTCYVSQIGDVVSKAFSLPREKVISAIKTNSDLYQSLVALKIEISNALVSIGNNNKEDKLHQTIRILMGEEISRTEEAVDEHGRKIKRTIKRKVNPQIAKQILTHEILQEDKIESETDLSENEVLEVLKERKKVVRLLPLTEKARIEKLFDKQQRAALEALRNKDVGNKIVSLAGAVRCGKTFTQAFHSIEHIEFLYSTPVKELKRLYECENGEFSKGQIFYIGRSAPAVYQNIFQGIFKSFKLNFSLPKAKAFLWNILKYNIRLLGYSKVPLESLKGVTADAIFVDESEHLDLEGFDYIISRLSNPWAKLVLTWNPKTPSHWLWQKVKNEEAQKKNHIRHFNFSLLDCEFADKHFIDMLEANHGRNSAMYKRFVLGLPASVSGQVYSQFVEEKHVFSSEIDLSKYFKVVAGYDHGSNSPRVYTVVGIYYDSAGKACVDVLDELYYPRGHGSIKKHSDYIAELEIFASQYPISKLYMPHDSHDMKKILKPLGYPVDNASRKLSVNSGIGLIQSLLSSGRMKIHSNCKNLINELFLYSYDESKDDDSIRKENDHCLDSLRYAIVSSNMFNKNEQQFNLKIESLIGD